MMTATAHPITTLKLNNNLFMSICNFVNKNWCNMQTNNPITILKVFIQIATPYFVSIKRKS